MLKIPKPMRSPKKKEFIVDNFILQETKKNISELCQALI